MQLFDLIQTFTEAESVVTVPKPFIKMFGLETASFLGYLLGWTGETTDDGFFWQTAAELKQETGLTLYAIVKARNDLWEAGFLETKLMRANGSPTVHFRVNEEAISEALDGKALKQKPTPQRPPRAGWLYVIKCRDLYKIGTTIDIDRRLRQLAKPIPFDLHLVHKSYYYDMIVVERLAHSRYRHKRKKGEWFQLTEEDLTWLKTL